MIEKPIGFFKDLQTATAKVNEIIDQVNDNILLLKPCIEARDRKISKEMAKADAEERKLAAEKAKAEAIEQAKRVVAEAEAKKKAEAAAEALRKQKEKDEADRLAAAKELLEKKKTK